MTCFCPPTGWFVRLQVMPSLICIMALLQQRGQRTRIGGVFALIRASIRVFGVSGAGVPSITTKGVGFFTP